MKRIIATVILFTFVLSFNCIYAADQSSIPNPTTIAKLQEIAMSNSRQAVIDDVDIKKKEMAVRTVRTTADMSDSILSITKPMDVQLELDVSKKTKQDNLNLLKVDVYIAATNIQLCRKEIELQEYKLEIAQEKLKMAQARLKAATVTQDVVDSAQYDVDSCKVDLENIKEDLNSYYLELKRLLNQPLDTTAIVIKDELKQEAFEDIDLEYTLINLYKQETSVYKASGKLEIAQTAMETASKIYVKGNKYYDNCAIDLEEAELDFSAAKTALDVKVKNKFYDMENRLDDIELAKKYTELSRKKLANAQTKYDKGTITKESYLSAKEAVMDAEYKELSAIVKFNATKVEFKNTIGKY
jgi:outer membrane protein TolC